MPQFRTIVLLKEGVADRTTGGRPHRRNVGRCKGCRATVYWCRTWPGLKAICFDENPEAIQQDEITETVSTARVHWASCPARDLFKRRSA